MLYVQGQSVHSRPKTHNRNHFSGLSMTGDRKMYKSALCREGKTFPLIREENSNTAVAMPPGTKPIPKPVPFS